MSQDPSKPSPARRRKPAAARAEAAPAEDGRKTYTFEGIELSLAAEIPPEILFDVIESEASEGSANEYLVNLRILRTLVGPDQFMTIRHRIGGDADKVWALMDGVLGEYGLTMGESSASPES